MHLMIDMNKFANADNRIIEDLQMTEWQIILINLNDVLTLLETLSQIMRNFFSIGFLTSRRHNHANKTTGPTTHSTY